MLTKEFDTIAAISTPLGEGAIGIVRLSGTESFAIAQKIFKGKDLSTVASHTLNYGHIVDPAKDEILDEVMIGAMRSPKTFTREDVIEINTHGGIAVTNEILQLVIREGARIAEPGEFTKRAFLNGRVDLTQAEAIMDIIRAKTDKAMNIAVKQLDGALSDLINNIRQEILNTLAQVEVNIDYPEYDDVEEMTTKLLCEKTADFEELLTQLLKTARRSKILREGISTAIIGRPNVGKSSLLNNLLREDKAIVTDIAGTTRDVIEEYVNINGVPLKLIDTAGIRKKSQVHEDVEYYSLVRGLQAMDRADVCLLVVDASVGVTEQDQKLANMAVERGCALVLLLNKWDLIDSEAKRDEVAASVAKRLAFAPWIASINVSALTGRSIDKVLAAALSAAESRAIQLKTSELNDLLAQIREGGHTVSDRGRRLKIQYATQTGSKPPVISFWCNAPDLVDDNYERFIENRLREKFSLVGTPIRFKFRKKVESN